MPPVWLLVDVVEGFVWLVAFVIWLVFVGSWIHWAVRPLLLKRQLLKQKLWRDEQMWQEFQEIWVRDYLLKEEEEDLHKPV